MTRVRETMKIGVQLPEAERELHWPEIRDIATTAEDCGFDSVWVGDHLLFRDEITGARGPHEAWSLLAALGEATERVQIGPLVAATSFHSPAMIAKKAATVDDISGGRLVLGLGAGWHKPEYDAFGFAYDRRVARFEEAFTVIHALLRDGAIDFEGAFYEIREMELLPNARPGIPLMVGSNGPRMLRITAPHVDLWNSWHVWFNNRPENLGPLLAEVDAACHETDRDPAEVGRTAAIYVQLSRGEGRIAGSSERPKALPISGSHHEIAERIGAFGEAGLSHIQVVLDPIDAAAVEELAEIVALM